MAIPKKYSILWTGPTLVATHIAYCLSLPTALPDTSPAPELQLQLSIKKTKVVWRF